MHADSKITVRTRSGVSGPVRSCHFWSNILSFEWLIVVLLSSAVQCRIPVHIPMSNFGLTPFRLDLEHHEILDNHQQSRAVLEL